MRVNLRLYHYTEQTRYKGISNSPDWLIRAGRPPTNYPKGPYFTTLGPQTRNLEVRLRIPRRKLAFMFHFHPDGTQPLEELKGGRGTDIVYSRKDYLVRQSCQIMSGDTQL